MRLRDPVTGLDEDTAGIGLSTLLPARRGRLRAAGQVLCLLLWGLLTVVALRTGGAISPAYHGYTVLVVAAFLIFGGFFPMMFCAASLAASLLVALSTSLAGPPLVHWAFLAVYTLLASAMVYGLHRRGSQAVERIRLERAALREAERQTRERAARLDLLSQLSQEAAGLPRAETLLQRLVERVAETFDYHNVTVFMVEGSELVMRACTLPVTAKLIGTARLPIGTGSICGWVARHGCLRMVGDVRREPLYRALIPTAPIGSELSIPMRIMGRVVGVLDVRALAVDAFEKIDLITLQTIADQTAIAIENARLYEETCRRAERLALVNRVGRAAGSTLELDRLLDRLHEEVVATLPCDAFFVALYDPEAGVLDYRVQVDEGVRSAPEQHPLGPGFTSEVIATRRPLLVEDFERQRQELPVPVPWGSMKMPSSWLGVPMLIGDEIVGVISIQAYRPRAYSEEDVQLLATLADQASVAVKNARLYEAVQQDLAERTRLESQLVQAQKMEAVGRLAGGVAHDFNNLLTSIGGCVDLLRLEATADSFLEPLDTIKAAVQRGAGLTRQLLAFSRKQVLKPERLNLNAVLREAEQLLIPLLGDEIELVRRLDEDLGWVKADAGQLLQVILNLAVNARDAMPAGGRLTFETANLELNSDREEPIEGLSPGSYVMLAVHDTGAGISPEVRKHLFEPFFTTKEVNKGTGLGLATVHGIVRQSGGSVAADNRPGRGATFRVYLPRLPDGAE